MNNPELKAPKIRLFGDRVLVVKKKDDGTEYKSAGGIILPPTQDTDSKAEIGTILKVSKMVNDDALDHEKLVKGDEVLYSSFAGQEIVYENESYKLLRITDIYGALDVEETE